MRVRTRSCLWATIRTCVIFWGDVIGDTGCEAVIELKKGAVAKVEMRRNAGSLSWCITPRILRTLHTAATESSRPKTSRK